MARRSRTLCGGASTSLEALMAVFVRGADPAEP